MEKNICTELLGITIFENVDKKLRNPSNTGHIIWRYVEKQLEKSCDICLKVWNRRLTNFWPIQGPTERTRIHSRELKVKLARATVKSFSQEWKTKHLSANLEKSGLGSNKVCRSISWKTYVISQMSVHMLLWTFHNTKTQNHNFHDVQC